MSEKHKNGKVKLTVAVIVTEFAIIAVLLFFLFTGGNEAKAKDNSKQEIAESAGESGSLISPEAENDTGKSLDISSVQENLELEKEKAVRELVKKIASDLDQMSDEELAKLSLADETVPADVRLSTGESVRLDDISKEQAAELAELADRAIVERRKSSPAGILEEADLKAAMYDYDAAIELVQSVDGYAAIPELAAAISSYEEQKAACVKWHDNTQISHIFFHSLIYDTSRAFGKGSSQPVGYNRYMTTVSEFNKMMESMYERGYVLVSIHDIARMEKQEDGTEKLVAQPIYLPEGKEPFVLSQDDVNYYAYMDKNGFAEKLVVGEDGLPTCMYIDENGTVSYGEYDVVPILDRFIREHPDFSYRGAKGILGVTGYEGALGYDTGLSMKKYDGMDEAEKMKLIEAEREEAIKVAEALKADGWEFASHSYTHTNMTNNSVDKVKYDTRRWKEEVEIILGPTDVYIYPYGADICDWRGYSGEKYEVLKNAGFNYFCNVDSTRFWVQIRGDYFRMGRINLDGERMYKTPEKLEYFFDVKDVYDHSRPAFD
ncbi:MAG: polysaccharide deacetylase family protein [Lachnospiraceae bacterium]|nr:polysaccharide deacetylase family protein [Lachnospiraceae bacterium]